MTVPLARPTGANVLSETMRPRPELRVAAFLDSIAVPESLDGIGRLASGRRRRGLADRFQDLLDELFEDRVVAWTLDDARTCARIMEDKRRRGEALDDHMPNAFLAAAAATRGLAVATRNVRELRNTGVETVDPWTARPP